jgi:two-component system, NtrC family, sensor histidine kinase PilS
VSANEGIGEERRHTDRRRGARRNEDAPFSPTLTDESLFDAIGVGLGPGAEPDAGAEQRLVSGWADVSQPADSRFLSRQAQRIVAAADSTFDRMYRTFVGARAVLGLALLAAQLLGQALGGRSELALAITLVYATQAVALWVLPRFRAPVSRTATRLTRRQWLATIGFDLLAFSALHAFEPASTFNYVALLVLPVLMAGVLTTRVPAVATAAAASLMLLAAAWRAGWGSSDPAAALTPAGLMGIGLFAITLLAGELAARLAREEMTARGSLELARQQAQLNRLVIEEMADGVLVVDRRARVRAANPAARRLLAPQGLGRAAPFQLQDEAAWSALAANVTAAFEAARWPDDAQDVTLHFGAGHARTVRLRA